MPIFYHKLMNNFRYFHTFIRIFIKNTKDIYMKYKTIIFAL